MRKLEKLSITLLLIAALALLSACGGSAIKDTGSASGDSQNIAQKPSESSSITRPVGSESTSVSDPSSDSADTENPSDSGSQTPANSESQKPASSESQKPASSESQKPASSESQKPASSESQKPASSESQKPASSESQAPVDDTVTMIDLASSHYSLATARTLIQNLGLKLEVRTQKETPDYEDNLILEQDVAAGKKVKKGTTIYVTVSKNVPKTVSVPNLVNRSEADALKLLQDNALSAEKSYDYSNSVATGKVISQSINANSSVQAGTTVKIVISKGAKPTEQQPAGNVTLNMFTAPTEQEKTTAASIVSSIIKPSMSEYDKVKAIHDYLVDHVTYSSNLNGANVHYARGAFAGDAVCQGYADAFSLLCYTAGIQADIVSGVGNNGSGSEAHAWNQVRIDNVWYNVDVTWDDPVMKDPNSIQIPVYDYFLVTNASINKNHTADNDHPAKNNCTDDRYRTQLIEESLVKYAKIMFPEETATMVKTPAEIEQVVKAGVAPNKNILVMWDTRLVTQSISADQDTLMNIAGKAVPGSGVHSYGFQSSTYGNYMYLVKFIFQ